MEDCHSALVPRQGRFDHGEVPLRRCIPWQPGTRGLERYPSPLEIPLPHPHKTLLEIQPHHWKGRNVPILLLGFDKQAFSFVNLASLSPHRGLSPQRADIWTRLRQMLADDEGLVVTPAGLKNGRSHTRTAVTIDAKAFSFSEISQCLSEAMQGGARLRACQESFAISRRIVYELFSQRLSALIIHNASQKLPTHDQQFRNGSTL
jgi:hypothetical protein